jgi:hypothetical protein
LFIAVAKIEQIGSQKWPYHGLERLRVLEADDFLAEYSLSVIKLRGWQSFNSAKLLSRNFDDLRTAFNGASGEVRIVLLLSPT